ncbi:MAG: hypothetical protein ACKVQB_10935 [Bacteroidia bacterium]
MQRLIILISLFLSAGIVLAQPANLDKAEKAIEEGYFERAYKLTEKALENEITKKNPLTYYLHARSLFELSKEDFFVKKNPEAFKDACKMILKAKQKDKDNKFEGKFDDLIADMVKTNNLLAYEEYSVNRYPKAIKIYNISYSMNADQSAYYMIGKSYQMSGDTSSAKSYYKTLIGWYDEAKKLDKEDSKPIVDPFLFMVDVYWIKKNYDSANYFLDVARSIFGEKNAKINFYQYLIAKDQILRQPPSSLMMEVVRKALVYSPSDTFLIKKENALALYLIRSAIDAPYTADLDTMILRFAKAKALKGNDPSFQSLKSIDIFLQPFPENVLWKISDYYYTNTHDKAASYIAKKYIILTATANDTIIATDKEIIARWIKIIEFAKENESPGFLALLMTQATTDYPNSKELTELKKKLLTK